MGALSAVHAWANSASNADRHRFVRIKQVNAVSVCVGWDKVLRDATSPATNAVRFFIERSFFGEGLERVKGIYIRSKSLIYKASSVSGPLGAVFDTVGILRC